MHPFLRVWRWYASALDNTSNGLLRATIALFVGIGLVILLPIAALYELVTRLAGSRLGSTMRWVIAAASFLVGLSVVAALSSPNEVASAPSAIPESSQEAPTRSISGTAATPTPTLTAVPSATQVPTSTAVPTMAPEPGFVSRATFGDDWPLTVESGVVSCVDGFAVLFLATGGLLYPINGTAITWYPDLPAIDEIWAAGTYAPKMNIKPLIDAGLALC